jgi:hypothetical protein
MSGANMIALLDLFGSRLPGGLAFDMTKQGIVGPDHPLGGEITAALEGRAASMPYALSQDVLWVTFAPSADALRRVIEDLRCWILPSFGWEGVPSIVSDGAGKGQMGILLLNHSPQGYFRWYSRSADTDAVIQRLATMRRVIEQAPARKTQLRPTLEMLRRQFTLGLAIGDRDAAQEAVEDIDQRQLDTASNALSMRIRLAAAFGDNRAIVEHPQLDDLLSMRVPRPVVESVLLAHHAFYLADAEDVGNIAAAQEAYLPLYDRLAGLAGPISGHFDPVFARMAAYEAALDEDGVRLRALASTFADDAVVSALAADFPAPPTQTQPEVVEAADTIVDIPDQTAAEQAGPATAHELAAEPVALPEARLDWAVVPSLIANGGHAQLDALLESASLAPDSYDPGEGDFVVELYTDAGIAAHPRKRAEADRVLTAVIDAYICEERFPRRERLPLYQTVLDIWSSNRSQSTDPIDGQLLLSIADAMLRLDGKFEATVAATIIRWWESRPVRSRLNWLGETLELLTEHSVSQDYLALWYEGAALIKVDYEGLSVTDRQFWHRLGRRLGLDAKTADDALGRPWDDIAAAGDPLGSCGFTKIAIVSLHERAAREAAAQIGKRTDANIIVVTDLAAGEGTASAATADVILYVWGATKHAVYRAFDKVRDRIEYVQGTGSASIVRALERRVSITAD